MAPILAFMCTGTSTGFDPVCNPTHSIIVVVAFFATLIAAGWALTKWLSTQSSLLRWTAAVFAGGISAWGVVGLLLSFA